MPILKCKMCGGDIQPTDEKYGICSSCGSKELLAEETSSDVNVFVVTNEATPSVEFFIKNALTFLDLKEYAKASDTFTLITDNFPDDYRGWWGLILCTTKNLTINSGDLNLIIKWYNYVKKLTTPEILTPLDNQFKKYLKTITKADAEKEYSVKKSNLLIYEGNIKTNTSNINKLQAEFNKSIKKKFSKTEIGHAITEIEAIEANTPTAGCGLGCLTFAILCLVSVISGTELSSWSFVPMLLFPIAHYIILRLRGEKHKEERLNEARKKYDLALQKYDTHIKAEPYLNNLLTQISKEKERLTENTQRKDYTQRCIDSGQDKLEEMLLNIRLYAIGENCTYDKVLYECRKGANGEKVDENIIK